MSYRIQLNMKTQEFIAIDSSNAKHIGKGNTIEKALQQLKKQLKAAELNNQRLFLCRRFKGLRVKMFGSFSENKPFLFSNGVLSDS